MSAGYAKSTRQNKPGRQRQVKGQGPAVMYLGRQRGTRQATVPLAPSHKASPPLAPLGLPCTPLTAQVHASLLPSSWGPCEPLPVSPSEWHVSGSRPWPVLPCTLQSVRYTSGHGSARRPPARPPAARSTWPAMYLTDCKVHGKTGQGHSPLKGDFKKIFLFFRRVPRGGAFRLGGVPSAFGLSVFCPHFARYFVGKFLRKTLVFSCLCGCFTVS